MINDQWSMVKALQKQKHKKIDPEFQNFFALKQALINLPTSETTL